MTFAQLMATVRKRWYVFMAVLVLTAGVGALLPRDTGVYWSRVNVVFLPPIDPNRAGNVLEGSDPSLIYFAAAVDRSVNGNQNTSMLSSSAATLYGTGIKRGSTAHLVNSGGQWRTNFNKPTIVLEAVDTSQAAAAERITKLIDQVESTARSLQADAGSSTQAMIRTELSPARPEFTFVAGKWQAAVGATALLGLALALAACVFADRLLRRREVADAS